MGNTYFQFKQFTVHQERCAMKVCTDACLFGAWMAQHAAKTKLARILDIGTGTGLLSLMLAQSTNTQIDSIELDTEAATQAIENFSNSPWPEKLHVYQGDVREIQLEKKYDLIISNPPFFENDLKSADQQRNLALHSSELDLPELLATVEKYTTATGQFAVLLPFHRKEEMIKLAEEKRFFVSIDTDVKQTVAHSFFRTMLLFDKNKTRSQHNEIAIKENNIYSAAFTDLLKDYYLHLSSL